MTKKNNQKLYNANTHTHISVSEKKIRTPKKNMIDTVAAFFSSISFVLPVCLYGCAIAMQQVGNNLGMLELFYL